MPDRNVELIYGRRSVVGTSARRIQRCSIAKSIQRSDEDLGAIFFRLPSCFASAGGASIDSIAFRQGSLAVTILVSIG
jgi:hypothetical protein